MPDVTWHPGDDSPPKSLAAEVGEWRLEVFPADDLQPSVWIWQAGHDHPAGPYLTAREVIQEGYADSREEAQAKAVKAMEDQEFAWSELESPSDWKREAVQRRQHDHTWVWNGSNFQCQCGASSERNDG
jgi:hypothetical protein